ncbi:Beta-galactosidase 8 [Castilleja foliolosa]|uniref:Beta-galactosidase 8 n=1 Tax=Castilleja foliolosa TaxID=1961234 RepID=A0ABD3DCR0_9LAMI
MAEINPSPVLHNHNLRSTHATLDPKSLIISEFSDSQKPNLFKLTTDSFAMERGPEFKEYSALREKKPRMNEQPIHERETDENLENRSVLTPQRKQCRISSSALRKENRRTAAAYIEEGVEMAESNESDVFNRSYGLNQPQKGDGPASGYLMGQTRNGLESFNTLEINGNGLGGKKPSPIYRNSNFKIHSFNSGFQKNIKINKNNIAHKKKFDVFSEMENDFIETALVSKPKFNTNNEWILDSGATSTMTYDGKDILEKSIPKVSEIITANGDIAHVRGAGKINLTKNISLSNCLYISALTCKLLSVSQVTRELNCVVLMYPNFRLLQDIRTKMIVGRGFERNGLYYINDVSPTGSPLLSKGTSVSQLWHRRLGHPSQSYFKKLFPHLPNFEHCPSCVLAKSHRKTLSLNNTRSSIPFEIVHSDVWGPL